MDSVLQPGDMIVVPEKALGGGKNWPVIFGNPGQIGVSLATRLSSLGSVRPRMPRMILTMGAFVFIGSSFAVSLGGKMRPRCHRPIPRRASRRRGPIRTESTSSFANADPGNDPPSRDAAHDNSLGKPLFEHVILDQKAIWTQPKPHSRRRCHRARALGGSDDRIIRHGSIDDDRAAKKRIARDPQQFIFELRSRRIRGCRGRKLFVGHLASRRSHERDRNPERRSAARQHHLRRRIEIHPEPCRSRSRRESRPFFAGGGGSFPSFTQRRRGRSPESSLTSIRAGSRNFLPTGWRLP